MSEINPVELARDLIRRPSVTPRDAGALDVLQQALEGLGFRCWRLPFGEPGTAEVDNLYARIGDGPRNFCFAGHTDVVPIGDPEAWTRAPFGGELFDDYLYGRGAADMKGAIASFAAAAARFLKDRGGPPEGGAISLLITGDEEGPAVNGTVKALRWLKQNGERLSACLVGEPTNPARLGDMVKIGRRGSLHATILVRGAQGHVAYPHLADNPVHHLVCMLHALIAEPLDRGAAHFQPSSLQVTTVDVGNPTANVIAARATARLNIRFNDLHTGAGLAKWVRETCRRAAPDADVRVEATIGGEAFHTPPGELSALLVAAAEAETGQAPELSTSGGTSDARFIKDYCPVAEFGLVGRTMHQVDERVAVDDIHRLSAVYHRVLDRYFARP